MCFRPSAIAGGSGNQVQMGECPHCGQPIAASTGITGGDCPNCGKPVLGVVSGDAGTIDPGKNTKLF